MLADLGVLPGALLLPAAQREHRGALVLEDLVLRRDLRCLFVVY